jgi:hypothetical protein
MKNKIKNKTNRYVSMDGIVWFTVNNKCNLKKYKFKSKCVVIINK